MAILSSSSLKFTQHHAVASLGMSALPTLLTRQQFSDAHE